MALTPAGKTIRQPRYRVQSGTENGEPIYIVVVKKTKLKQPNGNFIYKVEEQDPPRNSRPRSFEVFESQLVEIHPEVTNREVMEKARVQINKVDAEVLKNELPGLGIRAARTICKNRPKNGYLSLEQMIGLNDGLRIDWQQMSGRISFEEGASIVLAEA